MTEIREDRRMTDVSAVPSGSERVARPWRRRLRSTAYWTALIWLSFEVWAAIGDYQEYLEDPETYHRVYLKPELQQALSHIFGVLAAIALAFHLRGWRGRRFSRVTIGYFVFEVCCGIVGMFVDIVPICCT
jgi:hypothetical protein